MPLTGTPSMTPLPSGPTSVFQQPTYDPYATQPMSPPTLLSPSPSPVWGDPGAAATEPYYGQPTLGAPQPAPGFGVQGPPALFPQTPGFGPASPVGHMSPLRLFQHLRISETWLYGNDPGDLEIHDIFVSTTLAFPNFLWSGQPWFVSPGFGLHLWSDPADPAAPRPALPPRAYSAFLDLGWKSDPHHIVGVELSSRLGIFSDFDRVESDSFRPKGVALLRYNVTPNLAVKAGIEYLNRADIKLLPAGGFLWTPNPQTRWDIYFPQPKLATYLTTLGTREMWWYVAGEYGGGVWTVTLDDAQPLVPGLQPARTLMDINDIRVMLGVELNRPGGSGIGQGGMFIEAGYVFRREVILVAFPDESFRVSDTFMLRGGIAF